MNIFPRRIHSELPIFRYCNDDKCAIYTPGHITVVDIHTANTIENSLTGNQGNIHVETRSLLEKITERAKSARDAWDNWQHSQYKPVCLTVYISNLCNLKCRYCYSQDEQRIQAQRANTTMSVTSEQHVENAARLVARNCQDNKLPFTLVVHGGGEPTLHWDKLQAIHTICKNIADESGLDWFSYIATHGVIHADKAQWLTSHFSKVGLSCDGPPHIQNAQRPKLNNAETSNNVEQTASILRESGKPFSIRATITPSSYEKQREIAEYFIENLGAKEIRFEPSYGDQSFKVEQVSAFVYQFNVAREIAKKAGCELSMSGMRHDEIHGPFCHTQRQVLQITPDRSISACFLAGNNADSAVNIGSVNENSISLSQDSVRQFQKALDVPNDCFDCPNIYHCSRDCPDVCPITQSTQPWTGGFRCQLNKELTLQEIKKHIS